MVTRTLLRSFREGPYNSARVSIYGGQPLAIRNNDDHQNDKVIRDVGHTGLGQSALIFVIRADWHSVGDVEESSR